MTKRTYLVSKAFDTYVKKQVAKYTLKTGKRISEGKWIEMQIMKNYDTRTAK